MRWRLVSCRSLCSRRLDLIRTLSGKKSSRLVLMARSNSSSASKASCLLNALQSILDWSYSPPDLSESRRSQTSECRPELDQWVSKVEILTAQKGADKSKDISVSLSRRKERLCSQQCISSSTVNRALSACPKICCHVARFKIKNGFSINCRDWGRGNCLPSTLNDFDSSLVSIPKSFIK